MLGCRRFRVGPGSVTVSCCGFLGEVVFCMEPRPLVCAGAGSETLFLPPRNPCFRAFFDVVVFLTLRVWFV
jgi:hypothetical protein